MNCHTLFSLFSFPLACPNKYTAVWLSLHSLMIASKFPHLIFFIFFFNFVSNFKERQKRKRSQLHLKAIHTSTSKTGKIHLLGENKNCFMEIDASDVSNLVHRQWRRWTLIVQYITKRNVGFVRDSVRPHRASFEFTRSNFEPDCDFFLLQAFQRIL